MDTTITVAKLNQKWGWFKLRVINDRFLLLAISKLFHALFLEFFFFTFQNSYTESQKKRMWNIIL